MIFNVYGVKVSVGGTYFCNKKYFHKRKLVLRCFSYSIKARGRFKMILSRIYAYSSKHGVTAYYLVHANIHAHTKLKVKYK